MKSEWHLLLRRREQVDQLAWLIRMYPGPVPIFLHYEGEMRRIKDGISQSDAIRAHLVRFFDIEDTKLADSEIDDLKLTDYRTSPTDRKFEDIMRTAISSAEGFA